MPQCSSRAECSPFALTSSSRCFAPCSRFAALPTLFAEKYARCGQKGSLWARSAEFDKWSPTFAFWSRGLFLVRPNPWLQVSTPVRASTAHLSGLQAGMADGSVRTFTPGMDPLTWWAFCTPAGGEVISGE